MRHAALLLALSLAVAGCRKAGPPYSPKESMEMMRLEPGYRISLFANEPDVVSPVAMEFDENGRLYVVEDRGYPLTFKEKVGRVKLLEDANGDGRPDKVTVFADNLVLPTGVMRWKKGILVTDAPDLLYLEDTDGDGKADVRKVVLTGFPFTNPQHTVNAPVYGLDNWIYLAHENATTAVIFKEFADRGSDIRFPEKPESALKERGRNIRFRPDTGEIEALAGTSQFGHAFDDWGHHFTLNNSNHARHEVLAARYLKRNPDLPVAAAMENISDHGAAAKVFPIAPRQRFEMLTNVGEFTSACGLTLWHGSMFVAEPAHNLVHRDVLAEDGATFKASRARDGVEFLASSDPWFRPVNFKVGPDGTLYMMDYYRLVVEHPEWMSTNTHRSPELTEGMDRGRIYRIETGEGAKRRPVRLGSESDAELVAHLEDPNLWWRRTAQRLLVDRKAVGAAPQLAKLFHESPSAAARVHALWTLEGLGRLDSAMIEKALGDAEAGVRENAITLAESRREPALEARQLKLVSDPSPKVRLQLLAALGGKPAAAPVREKLLFGNLEDKWFQTAALSAGSDEAARLFDKAAAGAETPGRALLVRNLGAVIASRRRDPEMQGVLAKAAAGKAWWRAAALEGLAQSSGGRRREISARNRELLLALFAAPEPAVRRGALKLLESAGLPESARTKTLLAQAGARAADRSADPEVRADSLALLALAAPEGHRALFEKLVDPHEPEAVEAAAVRALGRIPSPETGAFLLGHWRGMTARARSEAADAMCANDERVRMLTAALKNGEVQPWTLAFRHKRRLIMSTDPAIRETARPLLEQSPADREAVVKRYAAALDRKADAARGKEVFKSICSKCHALHGVGAEVGPDLVTVRHQPKQVLLSDILVPSQSISQGYESYVVETVNGSLDGVLGPQTPAAITLRHEDGKEDVIQRKDIRNMYVTNLSAMPADLEKQIDVQQMADLLEYLKTVR